MGVDPASSCSKRDVSNQVIHFLGHFLVPDIICVLTTLSIQMFPTSPSVVSRVQICNNQGPTRCYQRYPLLNFKIDLTYRHTYIYAPTYIHAYTCTYLLTYKCTYIHTCIHTYIWHTYLRMYTCTHIYMYKCMYVYIYIHTYVVLDVFVCIYIYTYIYIYIYI